ncbi:MAG: hypothetical protein LBN42_01975, partial [Oscillospiraceae bacterium]|nr:hypothetical protein [Oscillospiraceae bacterium]
MFLRDDVTVLLKDITGQIQPLPTDDRERLIQGGRHYSEMLPLEYVPSDEYVAAYENALGLFAPETARAVAAVTDEIVGLGECVLVSLARAGTPLGVLVRRYARYRYGADLPHYTISIIRGRGIDRNAVRDIISAHPDKRLIFFDGWTGKGAIANTLAAELGEL